MKKLSVITSDAILNELPSAGIDTITGRLWLPFLYRIENVLDNISKRVEDPPGWKIDPEIIKAFCSQFPQFVSECKSDKRIEGARRYNRFYFYNDGILSDKPKKSFYISTFMELHPLINNQLIDFFVSRDIPVAMGLSIRKGSEQGTFDENFNEVY